MAKLFTQQNNTLDTCKMLQNVGKLVQNVAGGTLDNKDCSDQVWVRCPRVYIEELNFTSN